MTVGFIGLGIMGQPMALNLVKSGQTLVVWNRSPERCDSLRAAGAAVAFSPADLFERSAVVILMLVNDAAIDRVLERGTSGFRAMVAARTIVCMSSVSPEYSRGLEREVKEAGGRFVEAPVSGSRMPAEAGQLVAMLAGDEAVVDEIRPLLKPMCHETAFCGPAGNGLLVKLSVNLFMIVMATGLAEAVHFADRQGLDRRLLQMVLNAGPMASNYSRMKLAKLAANDYSAQAAAMDAWTNTGLIADAADQAHVSADLIRRCRDLFKETLDLGHGAEDLMAVIRAIAARSDAFVVGRSPGGASGPSPRAAGQRGTGE